MSQTINPNQIRPYGTDGQLVGTIAGETVPLKVIAGTGITVTLSGNNIVISASATPPPLTITGFSSGAVVNVELGFSIVNPAFVASYTGTPTSADITNTESIDSPHNLTTPFTAATLSGTFVHTTEATTTFTLHATDGVTSPTADVSTSWLKRIFGGIGAAGATSSVTASGTTAVLSTSDVLPTAQLGTDTVGTNFGPFTCAAQKIYLLVIGGSHTFKDDAARGGSGFPIPFLTPTSVSFVNANGVTVAMELYESVNNLTGTFYPQETA